MMASVEQAGEDTGTDYIYTISDVVELVDWIYTSWSDLETQLNDVREADFAGTLEGDAELLERIARNVEGSGMAGRAGSLEQLAEALRSMQPNAATGQEKGSS